MVRRPPKTLITTPESLNIILSSPRARITVEIINGVDARESPYADALLAAGFRRDYRKLVLSAGYR
jgi:hypothetical protein